MSDLAACRALARRELLVLWRRRGDVGQPIVVFLIVCTLFPLGAAPEGPVLAGMAPAIVWVGVLLAVLLALDPLVRGDLEDGTLELMLLSPAPLPLLVLAKAGSAWLATGLPLTLAAPVMAVQLGLAPSAAGVVFLTLLLGTPSLCLVGIVGVSLVVGLPRGGLLMALLLLPLYVPVLVFAAGSVRAAALGLPALPGLLMLGGILLLTLALAPFAAAAALRLRG